MAKKPSKPAKKTSPKDKKGVTKSVVAAIKKVAKAVAPKSAPAKGKVKPTPAPKAKLELKKAKAAAAPKKLDKSKKKPEGKAALPAKKASALSGKSGKESKGKKVETEILVEVRAPKGVANLVKNKEKKPLKAEGKIAKKRCREPACDHDPIIMSYCRLHYIKNWKRIKRKEAILASGQLNNYVEELVHKYPDKYLEVIRQDLASEKDWAKVVVDLELDSGDDEVAGEEESDLVTESVGSKRDFDDDTESF